MNSHSLQGQGFTSLEQLRIYHNERFIRLAYLAILGREAETEDLHHHLSLLGQNLSRTEFLVVLRTSPEAEFRWRGHDFSIGNIIKKKPNLLTVEDLVAISKDIN